MFATLDIYKAAYLSLNGMTYRAKYSKNKLMFFFDEEERAKDLLDSYQRTRVIAGEFADKVKEMRSLIYQDRKEEPIEHTAVVVSNDNQ